MQATDQLLETLHEKLATQTRAVETGDCFRLKQQDDGLVLAVEPPEAEDMTFRYSERTVLAVERCAAQQCGERTLALQGDKWVLQ